MQATLHFRETRTSSLDCIEGDLRRQGGLIREPVRLIFISEFGRVLTVERDTRGRDEVPSFISARM